MNKTELIKEIAHRTNITQQKVSSVINSFQDVIKDTVSSGDEIRLASFITFAQKTISAKSGTATIGGVTKEWSTPEKKVISAKLSKGYKAID